MDLDCISRYRKNKFLLEQTQTSTDTAGKQLSTDQQIAFLSTVTLFLTGELTQSQRVDVGPSSLDVIDLRKSKITDGHAQSHGPDL